MIKSFHDKATQALFEGRSSKRFKTFQAVAECKLTQLNNAATLDFLHSPLGNQLEKLTKDQAGQYSIRINDQWRVYFEWRDGDVWEVEIVDYHLRRLSQ